MFHPKNSSMDRLRSKRLKQTLLQLVPSQRHKYRYPLVNVYSLLLTMTIEIVRFPDWKWWFSIVMGQFTRGYYQRLVTVTTQVLHLDQAFAANLRLDSIHCPLPQPKVHRLGWSDIWLIALLLRFVFGVIRSDSKKNLKTSRASCQVCFFWNNSWSVMKFMIKIKLIIL